MPRTYIRHERKRNDTRKAKVYVPWWIDPYWYLVGTSIEHMVLAELSRRGVFFIYRSQRNDLGGFVDPTWEADFLLPQHKIWIEVQGSYFHSLPGQLENDAKRYAAIEMSGWHPHFLWEFDIRTRLVDLLNEIGVIYNVDPVAEQAARLAYSQSEVYGASPLFNAGFSTGGELVDQLVGLRKALSKRTKPPQFIKRRARKRRPK